jgi:hypothetical protein
MSTAAGDGADDDQDGQTIDNMRQLLEDEVEPDISWAGTLTVAQRQAAGKALRDTTPRSSHATWASPADRLDPIDLLEAQAQSRISELAPIRYGRMLASPVAFLRGSAIVMAQDLARTPTTGITVQ